MTFIPSDNVLVFSTTAAAALKGQLISKGLFWYPQFSQKMNEKNRIYYYDTSGRLVFVRFLGRN